MLARTARLAFCGLALLLVAGVLSAAEKKLMHCFYFTPVDEATEAQWQAFFKATDELPGKIPGLTKVWYGKLRRGISVFSPDPETRKKMSAADKTVTGQFNRDVRQWGACMEFDSQDALKTYADHPAHKAWEEVYFKVRQYGTTTFDILAQ